MYRNNILFTTATALLAASTDCIRKAHDTALIHPADFNGVCMDVFENKLTKRDAILRLYGLAHPITAKLPSAKVLNELGLDGKSIHAAHAVHQKLEPEYREVVAGWFFQLIEGTMPLVEFNSMIALTVEPEMEAA